MRPWSLNRRYTGTASPLRNRSMIMKSMKSLTLARRRPFFTVENVHLMRIVASAGNRARRKRGFDGGEIVGAEGHIERADGLLQPIAVTRSDQRDDVLPAG